MFEKAIRISNCGFIIEARKKVVDRDIAYEALTPKRQRKSTFAVREDNFVTITKHVVVCSFCGKETPAYEEYIRKSESNYQIKPQRLIETWLSRQMSIFGEQPKILTFNTPIKSLDRFVCPRCKTVLRRRNEFVDISFKVNRKSIKVSRKLQFNELFLVKWMTVEICISSFDIYEAITFNLRNGHTFVSLEDELGDKLRVRDVSNRKVDDYLDDPIFEVLNLCKPVYRELKRQFLRILNSPLPFPPGELTPEKYILITKFVGYGSGFYKSLPYAEKGCLIERSFSKSARKLHFAKNIPNIFEKTILPNVKSIRKIFFCKPELLFYTTELERLWQIIEDINLFRNFITSENVFKELMWLHKMPNLLDFYIEYKLSFGIKSLFKRLSECTSQWHHYAAEYLMLSPYDKKVEHKKWLDGFPCKQEYFYDEDSIGTWFSVPIPAPAKEAATHAMLECSIQGYSFRRLENTAEYVKAGKELRNCLGRWWFGGNVYGIVKKNKYVAAVEIDGKVIIQAHTLRNGDISNDKNLQKVFNMWKEKNMLMVVDEK